MTDAVHVTLTIDTTRLERALTRMFQTLARSLSEAMPRVSQILRRIDWRSRLTQGEHHIDAIVHDCLARRLDVTTTARRLMVAADIAAVIDGRERAS